MKTIRCTLGWQAYVKRQSEDSQYLACRRCGQDGPAAGRSPTPFGAGGAG